MIKGLRVSAAVAIVAASMAIPSSALAATVHPDSCNPTDPVYSSSSTSQSNKATSHFTGQADQTLQISITAGTSVGSSISGTVGFSISDIITSAKLDVSPSITQTKTQSVTYTTSWTVPHTWANGELFVGARMWTYTWKQYQEEANCSITVLKSGNGTSPWDMPYTWHAQV